ncbi:MAG: hypothetical protein ACI8WB_003971 [Phenylobacterium sp.]|jgi:hypothetical protein
MKIQSIRTVRHRSLFMMLFTWLCCCFSSVASANSLPIAVNDSGNIMEDYTGVGTIYPLANDYDVDGDSLSIVSLSVLPTHGVAQLVGSKITYTPTQANYCGPDSVRYRITDGKGAFAYGYVNFNVVCKNDLPIANDDAVFVSSDNVGAVDVYPLLNDTDVDNDTLLIDAINVLPTHGSATLSGGKISYTLTNAAYCGTDSVGYRITDGNGLKAHGTINYTIECGIEPPVNTSREDLLKDIKGSYSGISTKACFTSNHLNALLSRIEQSNVNTYVYTIRVGGLNKHCSGNIDGQMNLLDDLLYATANLGVNVWVSFNSAKTTTTRGEYLSLVNQVIAIKNQGQHSNLTAVSLDDFDQTISKVADGDSESSTYFTLPKDIDGDGTDDPSTLELAHIVDNLHAANMAFIPVAYYTDDLLLNESLFNDLKPYIDGVLFPYLYSANRTGMQVYRTSVVESQLKELKTSLGELALVVDIYATSYTYDVIDADCDSDETCTFRQYHSEAEYVKEVAEAAHRYADGIMIYHTQNDVSNNILYGSPLTEGNSAYGCPAVYFHNNEHSQKQNLISQLFGDWRNQPSPTGSTAFFELTELTHALTKTGTPKVKGLKGCENWPSRWPNPARVWENKVYTDYLYSSAWYEPQANNTTISTTKFVLAGHFDASNSSPTEDIVSFNLNAGQGDIFVYRANAEDSHKISQVPGGAQGNSWYTANASEFGFDAINHAVSGDFNGDGIDEIATFYDNLEQQQIVMFNMSGNQMRPTTDYLTTQTNFNVDAVKFSVAGDFDDNGKDELLAFYQDGNVANTQKVFAFEKEGSNSGFSSRHLYKDFTGSSLDFAKVAHVIAADFDQSNPGDELAILYTDTMAQVRMFRLVGGVLIEYQSPWFSESSKQKNFNAVTQAVAGDFDGDGHVELTLYYQYPGNLKYNVMVFDNDGSQNLTFKDNESHNRRFTRKTPKFVVSGNIYVEDNDDKAGSALHRAEMVSLHH